MNKMKKHMANSDEVGEDGVCDNDRYDCNENEIYAYMLSGDIFEFKSSHPGSKFTHLAEFKHEVIPKIFIPKGKLCNIEMLDINKCIVDNSVKEYREDYAKMALLMFYPLEH